jgi:hypothetical protein
LFSIKTLSYKYGVTLLTDFNGVKGAVGGKDYVIRMAQTPYVAIFDTHEYIY